MRDQLREWFRRVAASRFHPGPRKKAAAIGRRRLTGGVGQYDLDSPARRSPARRVRRALLALALVAIVASCARGSTDGDSGASPQIVLDKAALGSIEREFCVFYLAEAIDVICVASDDDPCYADARVNEPLPDACRRFR